MLQHATHTIVVLDTAWPWASEAYGLCRLCAYFCAHKLISSLREGDGERKIIRCYSPNRDGDGVLAANKNELAALSKVSALVLVLGSWVLVL